MISRAVSAVRRVVPTFSLIGVVAALLSAIVHVCFVLSPAFADGFNQSVAAFFRALFSTLTVWIPFSVAETLILAIPLIFVTLLVICLRRAREGWIPALRCVVGLLSIVALIYVMFVLTFAAGYQATPLADKMEIATAPVSPEQLRDTAMILAGEAQSALDDILFRYHSHSVMPYSYDTLSEKLMVAYQALCEDYPFIQSLTSRFKPINLSEPMTYTHISGVYTMFTGEANVNVHYPDYVIPYTAAHELAHQRGIARENEANFVAFLVCAASDDPYIRYSGYLNLYEYVASALYSASPEMYYEVLSSLDLRVRYEMQAYSRFFDQYRDNVAADVSQVVNNSYLTMQGTVGTKSYGMVVDLAVAYLLSTPEEDVG